MARKIRTADSVFGDHGSQKPKKDRKKSVPREWTIVTALETVLDLSEDSGLTDSFWKQAEPPLAFLRDRLSLTSMQLIIVAILIEAGESRTWKGLGEHLGCHRLTMMTYSDDVENLIEKGWIMRYGTSDFGGRYQGFKLVSGVVTALRKNQVFVPEKISGLTQQQLIDRIELHAEQFFDDSDVEYEDNLEVVLRLLKANPGLPVCREALDLPDPHQQMLFVLAVLDYSRWADSRGEGITMRTVENIFPLDYKVNGLRKKLNKQKGPLFERGLIENRCDQGIVEPDVFVLTHHVKNDVLSDFTPSRSQCSKPKTTDRDLIGATTIREKQMFYNSAELQQVERLGSLLLPENFDGVQRRLEEEGMRKGFACIFYGAPGTGKTETVLQLARLTGRDILRIEIAGLKDKWVGESEKNIKSVFSRYSALCRNCEKMPILFFNEADAIFGRRFEMAEYSADKMNNAMQNIILQEMENLEGILIATTNLTGSLDPAFERRFLFKVRFCNPEADVKAKIWKAMLGTHISDDDAYRLAQKYDFSGGQIENIARKRTIDYILDGKEVAIDKIESYCENELIGMKNRPSLGFRL